MPACCSVPPHAWQGQGSWQDSRQCESRGTAMPLKAVSALSRLSVASPLLTDSQGTTRSSAAAARAQSCLSVFRTFSQPGMGSAAKVLRRHASHCTHKGCRARTAIHPLLNGKIQGVRKQSFTYSLKYLIRNNVRSYCFLQAFNIDWNRSSFRPAQCLEAAHPRRQMPVPPHGKVSLRLCRQVPRLPALVPVQQAVQQLVQ